MKKLLCIFLVTTFLLDFMIGCTSQPIVVNSHPLESDPFEHHRSSIFKPMLFASLASTTAAVLMVLFLHPKKVKLTPKGEEVTLLIHDEAPAGAKFLGEVESHLQRSAICVKNDLRNRAADMGGNLVVVDNINSEVWDGQSTGFSGSGRVYYVLSGKTK